MSSPNTHKGASVKSADRVIAILELFAHRQKPLNLTEIASELGYPMSSVLALLKSLCASEYLRFNQESKTYMPTLRVPMLGSWIMGELFQNGSIIALMDQIQKETGETVILGARNRLHAQYLHTVQSQRLLRYYQKPGQVRPMTQSAVGKALLMQFTNNEISHFILQLNQNTTLERTLVKEQNILEDIRKARQAGYAMTDRLTQGICAIGMPLPLYGGTPCAIAVAGPSFRIKRKEDKIVTIIRQLSGMYLKDASATGLPPVSQP